LREKFAVLDFVIENEREFFLIGCIEIDIKDYDKFAALFKFPGQGLGLVTAPAGLN
jgi:hypothetical protein